MIFYNEDNLFGTHDNFDLETSHVLPAIIRKFHDAKLNGNTSVTLWGSGTPMREFLYVEDLSFTALKGYGFVASTSVKAINELLNINIPEDSSITIGGYVSSYARSERIQLYKGAEIEILNVKIKVLKIP